MEVGKSNTPVVRTEDRRRSPEATVAVNIDPMTTTGSLTHLVMDQVRGHKNAVDAVDITQTIDLAPQLVCRVLIVGELVI